MGKIAILCAIAIALFWSLIFFIDYQHNRNIWKRGIPTKAVIVGKTFEVNGKLSHHSIEIKYEAKTRSGSIKRIDENILVEYEIYSASETGHFIDIVYDPKNPQHVTFGPEVGDVGKLLRRYAFAVGLFLFPLLCLGAWLCLEGMNSTPSHTDGPWGRRP
jgi:hypothetical protein